MTSKLTGTRANCSTIFLLPGIGLFKRDIEKQGFLSAYIDDVNHSIHYDNAVYVLYRPDDIDIFQEFLKKEKGRTPLLLEDYDYEGGYIVTVYGFPVRFIPEYKHFLKGAYSKFSTGYKEIFPTSIQLVDEAGDLKWYITLQYHIFNRTDAIKNYWENKIGQILTPEMECWSKPNMENEVLNINDL